MLLNLSLRRKELFFTLCKRVPAYRTTGTFLYNLLFYFLSILIALSGQVRAQAPQAIQTSGSGATAGV